MSWKLFQRHDDPLWYIEWMDGQQRREACLGTADPAAADRHAAVHLTPVTPVDTQTDHAPDAAEVCRIAHTLEDLLAHGVADNAAGTVGCYTQRAGHILRLLGEVPFAALHLDQVQTYIESRLAEGAGRETVRKELTVLRRALDLAHRRGHAGPTVDQVLPRFKTRYVPRKVWLSPEQFERLLGVLHPSRALWVLAAVYTGGCLSELTRLEWQDVNFEVETVHLRGTKALHRDRLVPLHARLAEALQAQRRARGPLLRPWTSVRRDLAVACKAADVPRVCPNDLRRTFASWLVQRGVTSYVTAQLMGHSSSYMVERVYGRLSTKALRNAVDRLPTNK